MSAMDETLDINLGNPHIRLRRLRQNSSIRALTQEHHLTKNDFIYPIFISEEGSEYTDIVGMPGIYRIPYQYLQKEIASILEAGIQSVMLFPVISDAKKNPSGSEALNPDGLMQKSIRKIKQDFPNILLFADVALDPYTTHGHDGLIDDNEYVLNDETVSVLCKMALSYAQCGIDFVCPSDMMDGRIGAIRTYLDKHRFIKTGILAYSLKFASAFYGPFREAVGSVRPRPLDKHTYQVNPANSREALREVLLDVEEGADMVIVKPGLPYIDLIAKSRDKILAPIAVYQVSGEYAMLKVAAESKLLDEKKAVLETFLALKRAGADIIISYYAKWACENIL